MSSNLFKKLNDKLEVNNLKNKPLSEEERKDIEKKIIFNDLVSKTNESILENK